MKKLVFNFFWICFIMKVYITCYAFAQISYLGKICFLIHVLEMFSAYQMSLDHNDKIVYKFLRIKCWLKTLVCMVKNGCGYYGHGTLKLAVSQERFDGINWFICVPASIYLLKVNNRNTRTRCEICSKLTIKLSERRRCLYCCFSKMIRRNKLIFLHDDTKPKVAMMIL